MSITQLKRAELSHEHPADGMCPICQSTNTDVANFTTDRIQHLRCNDCGSTVEVDWS